ncbi:retinitis pigmentosa GTPase regulator b [Alosa alosa]|uniref:retinitis pigmentosa GTPase regulator b n=1 Tax=Alosa alosa TaxID=278164 RepID=UPI0020151450|nr:retinitis pigmentosa GTPase regulator b [Alosa alosa]
MAGETEDEIPESGAVFTFGKSKFSDNIPSRFWLKNDTPSRICCGDEHTALITEKGKLFMFGSNNWGQLGFGTQTTVSKPTCVKALKTEKVKLAACGRSHTLVYTTQGNVYATGGNSEGQLGLGDYDERSTFQLVDFFNKRGPIKMLAAGSNTSAALTQNGVLYVWGDNSEGQIGLGKESNAVKPQKLSVGRPVTWVACGYYHSALVTVDGELFTFGERDSGKLGLPTNKLANHRVPQLVEGITDRVLQVACGGGHTVALTEDCLYTFGLGQFGQLGHGTFIFESRSPRAVDHFRKGRVRHVACGENHTAVITDCGLLYTFGDGRHGKLGLGEENFTNQFKPTLCPRFLKYHVDAVTCGGCHMLVFAKSRSKAEEEVTLEEDDVTEDFWEKPYTELLGDTVESATLQRSLSARVRRRERERSPEQFGVMFRTLPPLSSAHLGTTILPVPSQTLPPRLHPTDLQDRNDLNRGRAKKSGLSTRIGKAKKEKSKGKKSSPADAGDDSESVKDLGETTDILNVTHMMKMDPSDQSLTLSPVHKKTVKLVKKQHGKAPRGEDTCPESSRHELTPKRALPTERLQSPSSRSLLSESGDGRGALRQAPQTRSGGKENVLVPTLESGSRAQVGKGKRSEQDSRRGGSRPYSPVQMQPSKEKGQLIELAKPVKAAKAKSVIAETKGEELSHDSDSTAGIKPSTKDQPKLSKDKRQELKSSAARDAGVKMVGGLNYGLLTPEPVHVKHKSSGTKEAHKAKETPEMAVMKSKPSTELKTTKGKSKPVMVQSKPAEGKDMAAETTSERDSESPKKTKEDLKKPGSKKPGLVRKPDPSDEQQISTLRSEAKKTTTKTKPGHKGPIVVTEAGRATSRGKLQPGWDTQSELEPEPKTSPTGTLSAVSSMMQDVDVETATRLVKTVAGGQLFSRPRDTGSAQSTPRTRPTGERFTKQRAVSTASSKSEESTSAAQPSKRTAATINVRPDPGSSGQEEPDSEQGDGDEEGSDQEEEEEEEGSQDATQRQGGTTESEEDESQEGTESEEDESQEGTESEGRALRSGRSEAKTKSGEGESGTRVDVTDDDDGNGEKVDDDDDTLGGITDAEESDTREESKTASAEEEEEDTVTEGKSESVSAEEEEGEEEEKSESGGTVGVSEDEEEDGDEMEGEEDEEEGQETESKLSEEEEDEEESKSGSSSGAGSQKEESEEVDEDEEEEEGEDEVTAEAESEGEEEDAESAEEDSKSEGDSEAEGESGEAESSEEEDEKGSIEAENEEGEEEEEEEEEEEKTKPKVTIQKERKATKSSKPDAKLEAKQTRLTASAKGRSRSGRKQSNTGSQESQQSQFWEDVLPQYLHLKDGAGEASQETSETEETNQDGDEDEDDEGVEEMEGSEEEEEKDQEKEEEDLQLQEAEPEPDKSLNASSPQEAEVEKEKEEAAPDGAVKEKEEAVPDGAVKEKEEEAPDGAVKEKEEEAPDGAVKETEEKVDQQPQTEEVLETSTQPQTEKEEKSRSIFGPNRRSSLFQRQPSNRRQQSKDKMEGLSESTSTGKPVVEGSSMPDQSVGDAGRSICSETQQGKKGPAGGRSRSATCVLL